MCEGIYDVGNYETGCNIADYSVFEWNVPNGWVH